MTWSGDRAAFVRWAVEVLDLSAFRAGLASVPAGEWPAVAADLTVALERDASDEPTDQQLRVGARLTDRLRSPAALLRRQIRLEKLNAVLDRQR